MDSETAFLDFLVLYNPRHANSYSYILEKIGTKFEGVKSFHYQRKD